MILLVDNYDSFSFNLVQVMGELVAGREELKVIRNDGLTVSEIMALEPSHIVLSPGPGKPADAGVCEALIREVLETPFHCLEYVWGIRQSVKHWEVRSLTHHSLCMVSKVLSK